MSKKARRWLIAELKVKAALQPPRNEAAVTQLVI